MYIIVTFNDEIILAHINNSNIIKKKVLENGLRGRPLNGLKIGLGDSKIGNNFAPKNMFVLIIPMYILKGLIIDQKVKGEEKSFKLTSHFEEINSWQLDEPKLNERTEPFNKAMSDWFKAMEIVTQHYSTLLMY